MSMLSEYSKIFDSDCINWSDDQNWNLLYLRHTQTYFNDVLKNRGYVFLRDVYEYLGIPVTKASIIVGWVYDPKNILIDSFIDFGLEQTDESDILMNFNVDGNIIKYFKD